MKNNDEFFIDITPGEAPDFDMEMSSEEKAQLTANVLERIDAEKKQNEGKKVIKFHKRIISLIAAAVLLIASTTAIATISSGQLKIKPKKEKETQIATVDANIQKITETTITSPDKGGDGEEKQFVSTEKETEGANQEYVYVDAENLQDYTMIEKSGGWYSFENQDNTRNFDCQVIYADTEWSRDYIVEAGLNNSKECIPNYQWLFVGDKKALYVKYEKDWVYSHQLFVRYKKFDYALNIIAPPEINKDELKDFAKKIELKACSQDKCSEYVKFSEYLENYFPDEMKGEIPKRDQVDYSKVAYINQFMTNSQLQYTVEGVTEYKNISGFLKKDTNDNIGNGSNLTTDKGAFSGQVEENSNLYTYSDGTLCSYIRSYVYIGDGINTPKQKVVYQNVEQKFYTVRLRIKNVTNQKLSDISLLYPLRYISENEDFYYDTDVYTRPVGINSCQLYNQPKYFSPYGETLTLEAGAEQVVEIGYFVDEDLDDNMFMVVSDYCVDIRN